MRGPLALCSLPLLCHGLRHEQRRQEPSRPVGRHIQYLGNSYGSGIGDRVGILIWLTDLGNYWNATIHMKGGPSGAAAYLNSKHSKNVSSNWSTYFDLGGGCGIDPFNEVEDFDGCVPVTDPQTDFSRLFGEGQGDGCVNLMERRWTYKGHWDQGSARRCDVWAEGLAPGIYNASKSFLASHGVPARFGAYHIRRCDRLNTNEVCTDPEVIKSVIGNATEVDTWMMFSYAEKGYIEKLKDTLNATFNCTDCTPRKFVFEDDVELNPKGNGDNYYTWLIANDILRRSTVHVETTYCSRGVGSINRRQPPTGMLRPEEVEDEESWSDDHLFGVCGGVR